MARNHHPAKFVSVNLNRSYGPTSSPSSHISAHGRPRPVSSGGGMVVLSRPRSSGTAGPKAGAPRLAVPPPLNLPSLRKEHQRLDPSAGPAAASGPGSAHGVSAPGWTKAPDKLSAATAMPSVALRTAAEKAVFLRGEDFPSLSSTVTSEQKQKEFLIQRQKLRQPVEEQGERPEPRSPLRMRPQMRPSRLVMADAVSDGDRELGRLKSALETSQKMDGFLTDPLLEIRLPHKSNWADDERDTGLSFPERDQDPLGGRGSRDAEVGDFRTFFRGDSYGMDLNAQNKESRDVSSWRSSLQQRDGLGLCDSRADRDNIGVNREMDRENSSYSYTSYVDSARDGFTNGSRDSRYAKREFGYSTGVQNGKNVAEIHGLRGSEQNNRSRYGDSTNSWFKKDTLQSSTMAKDLFSSGSKGFSLNDPILNFGREKRFVPNSGKQYLEDSGLDCTDLLADVNVKVLKRKKEMLKQADFHDPVRESFEAELERVQRMQEQERQRVLEEQARALEIARKEQEERERLVREEEERRQRLEDEVKEAAWRAEQERLEASRRAEEQRAAREEEKRRMHMEEERRKEAARQKLLELEARIARRQVETNRKDDKIPTAVADAQVPVSAYAKDVQADIGEWEDSERMVERITSSASSDSSSFSKYFDAGSRPNSSRDANSSAFVERGRHSIYWRRDACDNGNNTIFRMQDEHNLYRSPKQDSFLPGRNLSRREFHDSSGLISVGLFSKGGRSEPSQAPDDFRILRGERWNRFSAGDGDHFNTNIEIDSQLLDNDKFGDGRWGPDRSRGSPHVPYADRLFHNSEVDGFSSFGRSRHSLRQPRVLPPPSLSSMHRGSIRGAAEHSSSSSFLDSETQFQNARQNEEQIMQTGGYEGGTQERLRLNGSTALLGQSAIASQQEEKNDARCDSQSSLSVSSPPSSPTQLSHEDLDESRDSPELPIPAVGDQNNATDNELVEPIFEVGETNIMVASNSVSPGDDEEWVMEKNEEMQDQDEYDEEDDRYHEEDEPQEGDDENLDLVHEIENLQSDGQKETREMVLVLGFNEGVEVRIPSIDDFERTSRHSENATTIHASPVDAVQKLLINDDDSLQSKNVHPNETVASSSHILNETEKAFEDLVLDPVVSTNYLTTTVETPTSNPPMPFQQPASPAVTSSMVSTLSVQSMSTSTPMGLCPADVPVKLQFGLFSGPSLIPTPVPAIQIGSIQMPLHLPAQVGPSIAQMHASQPPVFQFGQLRYAPPMSQGILPFAPQTLSFVQPPASAHYPLNQNREESIYNQSNKDPVRHDNKGDRLSFRTTDKQPGSATKPMDVPQNYFDHKQLNAMPHTSRSEVLASPTQTDRPAVVINKTKYVSAPNAERHVPQNFTVRKSYRLVSNRKDPQTQLHVEPVLSQMFSREKAMLGPKASNLACGGRGRRLAYSVRNADTSLSFPRSEPLRTNAGGFHKRSRRNTRRTEFRIRENTDRREIEGLVSSNSAMQDRLNSSGRVSDASAKYGGRKDTDLQTSAKLIESDKLNSCATSRVVGPEDRTSIASGNESVSKRHVASMNNSNGEGQQNGTLEEDVDAPLQSGVVRVFKQPGIEAPSDEDDFIEVRSKRQMLNDRREQREKEIMAKSRVIKASRKHRAVSQNASGVATSNRSPASFGGGILGVCSDPILTDGRSLAKVDPSPVFTASLASQTLPPIGTPVMNADSMTRSSQTASVSVISCGGTKLMPSLSFENKKTTLDNASTSLVSWGNADMNEQVMALTQTQLDEAMTPVRFEEHEGSSVTLELTKPASSILMDPSRPSTSIMVQENLFCSSTSPLNSLLSGEKIQFGAVTSPTILPLARSVSNGIGPLGPCRSEVSMGHNSPGTKNDRTIFYDKEKHVNDSCVHLEDPDAEAEAEAAASAVAVAAISNSDDMVGNRLGVSVSVSDTKTFRTPDPSGLASGGRTATQEVSGKSCSEESLTVALPADLSVDTPLSLWPPLPSPQSSSGPMLSHFPGVPPSHFPCFEMNPILGPIFAFGPHDESVGTQTQVQRSTTMSSGQPLGAWPQCHSGVDSFYGSPAGFAGPFISPGGIPGVQGPPHMVVYNHFTPVGQFGQVGLSFMGTTYIPTGKQTDWKHNPLTSAVGVSEGDASNINVIPSQRNPPSMPAPLQHLAPGSPLMTMPSPWAMFDMSPFQSSAEVPMQARWSHIPAPPLHAVPLTVPLQQPQVKGVVPSQFSQNLLVDTNTTSGINGLIECRSSTPKDATKNTTIPSDAASQFPDELVLVDPPSASPAQTVRSSHNLGNGNSKGPNNAKSQTRSAMPNATSSSRSVTRKSTNGGQNMNMKSSSKPQAIQQASSLGQQNIHTTGNDDRGVNASHKMSSAGEWHRRMGFHGRNQSLGSDKSFGSNKVKQIYVAKQPASGHKAPQ